MPPAAFERWCARDDPSAARHGPFESYWAPGKPKERGSYVDGTRSGEWLSYDDSGRIRSRLTYAAGLRAGSAQRLDDNGNATSSGVYQDGWRDGEWMFFLGSDTSAGLRAKVTYVSGRAQMPIFIEGPQGEVVSPDAFALGTKEGEVKIAGPGGALIAQGPVSEGRRQGVWNVFYPSGKPASRAGYRNDRLEGPFAVWDEEGKVVAEGSFASSVLDSLYTDRFNPLSKNLKVLATLAAPPAWDPLRVSSGLVVASKDGIVSVIRPQTGAVAWRRPIGPALAFAPMAAPGSCSVALLTTDRVLRLLDGESGETCSEIQLQTELRPVLASRKGEGGPRIVAIGAADRRVSAVDVRDGREVWHYDADELVTAAPLLVEGESAEERRVVVGDARGRVIWLDLATGKKEMERGPGEEQPGPVLELAQGGDLLHAIRSTGAGFVLEPYTMGGRRESGFRLDQRPKMASGGALTAFASRGQLLTYLSTTTGVSFGQTLLPRGLAVDDLFVLDGSVYLISSSPPAMLRVDVGRLEWKAAHRLPQAMSCPGPRVSLVDGRSGMLYLGCDNAPQLLALPLPPQGTSEAWRIPDRRSTRCMDLDGVVLLRPVDPLRDRVQGLMAVDALSGVKLWEASAAFPSSTENLLAIVGPIVIFDHDGWLTARSRVSGRVLWEHALAEEIIDGECVSSPAPTLVFGPQQPYWDAQPVPSHLARPVVVGTAIYVSTSCGIAAFDAVTGVLEWVVPSPTPGLTAKLAVAQSAVLAGNEKGVWGFEPSTGKMIWSAQGGAPFAVSEDRVVTFDGDKLVTYDALTGEVAWRLTPPSPSLDPGQVQLSVTPAGTVEFRYLGNPDTRGVRPYVIALRPDDGRVVGAYDAGMVTAGGPVVAPETAAGALCAGPLNQYSSASGIVADRTMRF